MLPGVETFVASMVIIFGGLVMSGSSIAASKPRWTARIVFSILIVVILLNTGEIGRYAFARTPTYAGSDDYLRRFVFQFGVVSLSLFLTLLVEYAVRAFRRD